MDQDIQEVKASLSPSKQVTLRMFRAFLTLLLVGLFIGVFHHNDVMVASVLAIMTPLYFYRIVRAKKINNILVLLFGTLLSGMLGVQVEVWGISNGYWAYHDLPNERDFAYWLPFAWAMAFIYLYRLEESFIRILGLRLLRTKILVVAICAAILPTWGEIVVINLGTWSYYWPYQFFGVPMLAILLLMVFHVSIYAMLTFICRVFSIEDLVFCVSSEKSDSKIK